MVYEMLYRLYVSYSIQDILAGTRSATSIAILINQNEQTQIDPKSVIFQFVLYHAAFHQDKTNMIFREKNTISFGNHNLQPLPYIQWNIPRLLGVYQIIWKNPFVHKG